MDPVTAASAVKAIDLLITGVSAALNTMGASRAVSDAVAARIAEGREWTDAERALVNAEMLASKKYAAGAIAAAQEQQP